MFRLLASQGLTSAAAQRAQATMAATLRGARMMALSDRAETPLRGPQSMCFIEHPPILPPDRTLAFDGAPHNRRGKSSINFRKGIRIRETGTRQAPSGPPLRLAPEGSPRPGISIHLGSGLHRPGSSCKGGLHVSFR